MTKKRIGVVGTFVWDVIHGRDARGVPVEEWGGITYSLSGLDAALPDDWEIVPLLKVGADLAAKARQYLRTLRHIAPDAALGQAADFLRMLHGQVDPARAAALDAYLATVAEHGMNASTFAFRSSTDVKLPRFSTFLATMLNRISTWFIHEACFGV